MPYWTRTGNKSLLSFCCFEDRFYFVFKASHEQSLCTCSSPRNILWVPLRVDSDVLAVDAELALGDRDLDGGVATETTMSWIVSGKKIPASGFFFLSEIKSLHRGRKFCPPSFCLTNRWTFFRLHRSERFRTIRISFDNVWPDIVEWLENYQWQIVLSDWDRTR